MGHLNTFECPDLRRYPQMGTKHPDRLFFSKSSRSTATTGETTLLNSKKCDLETYVPPRLIQSQVG